jgi:magnesium chelatase family protein
MIASVSTACLDGIEPHSVEVEADLGAGLPSFTIVGLADKAVQEARERVKSALRNSGFVFPSHRLTISLAPAQIPKEGSAFDLAIAIAVLAAAEQLPREVGPAAFIGEIGLDGTVRPVRGALTLCTHLGGCGVRRVFVPEANAEEAADSGVPVYPVGTLTALVADLRGEAPLERFRGDRRPPTVPPPAVDLAEIEGQTVPKRALEIAAAGGHHVLFVGPPGAGKSMLARALAGLLPDLCPTDAKEVTGIHSAAGLLRQRGLMVRPPLRSPHHTTSVAGLIGGGRRFIPGEVTLANKGVLVLDELPEFHRDCLEALREPLEEGVVRVDRAAHRRVLPAAFTLAATANPCPCGAGPVLRGGGGGRSVLACTCPPEVLARYQRRISGPLRDRIDLMVEVQPVTLSRVRSRGARTSAQVAAGVAGARARQQDRQRGAGLNAHLHPRDLEAMCPLEPGAESMVPGLARAYNLSGRGFHGVLRVARSVADLAGATLIAQDHLLEACEYRAS